MSIIKRKDEKVMKYKIFCSADYHWGAMDPDKQKEELKFIDDFLDKNVIDLFVICGDYYDHRLLLNSRSAVYSIEFIKKLITRSESSEHPFVIRLFMGTKSHDNDQLDALKSLEDGSSLFKIFKDTSYEETLKGLHCIYCPDELLYTDDYLAKYNEIVFSDYTNKTYPIDIMFFHGTFDVIMPDILKGNDNPNVVFEYSLFNTKCSVMIGGHWHDGDVYGNMYYTRSPNRFKFNEDRSKGAILLTYDTDTQKYETERIVNNYTDEYKTYIVDTSFFNKIGDYSDLCSEIETEMKENKSLHIRVQIFITDEKEINSSCIESVRYKFDNVKNIKVTVENKVTKKKKEERKKKTDNLKSKFSFLFDDSLPLATKYRLFIKETKGVDIPEDHINSVLEKYV